MLNSDDRFLCSRNTQKCIDHRFEHRRLSVDSYNQVSEFMRCEVQLSSNIIAVILSHFDTQPVLSLKFHDICSLYFSSNEVIKTQFGLFSTFGFQVSFQASSLIGDTSIQSIDFTIRAVVSAEDRFYFSRTEVIDAHFDAHDRMTLELSARGDMKFWFGNSRLVW